ncbi:MAG TPA: UDP-N-acetylmuramate--L-alanine ligase [Thermoanaerobaculia bacterium]|nr:UDP-N-acetylmuramate--L-alanine ligase [Thermoanaerobaculia bacterium]
MIFQRFGLERIHFIGVGGAGMCGIAEVLLNFSLDISGCDMAASETTERLRELGATIHEGHSPDHLDEVDLVVISSAIPADNPELVAARERGLTVVRRAEMLGELMRVKYGVGIAGTHGKTTTTSMVGAVLTEAGLDPTVIVGGRVRVLGTGARVGKGELLVAEADEFDRSFLRLTPVLAVVTNIDVDHLDTYGTPEEIEKAFVEFTNRVPFFGRAIVCLDDPWVQRVMPKIERRIVTYGLSAQAELQAYDVRPIPGGSRFQVRTTDDGPLGEIDLPMPGLHNVRNALAAVAVALAVRVPFDEIARALGAFAGVHRRFELLGRWRGAWVIDDYAHHPTEVVATLEGARQSYPEARVHVVFQPHLFSRTRDLAAEFGAALLGADHALVTAIYPSREEPIPGVSGDMVVDEARSRGHRAAVFCPTHEEVVEALVERVREGDVVITMGAGDINRLGSELVEGPDGEVEG